MKYIFLALLFLIGCDNIADQELIECKDQLRETRLQKSKLEYETCEHTREYEETTMRSCEYCLADLKLCRDNLYAERQQHTQDIAAEKRKCVVQNYPCAPK